MKHLHVLIALRVILAAMAMSAVASVGAAPIFSAGAVGSQAGVGSAADFSDTGAPIFSAMSLNGGHSASVAFLGDDNSIVIGRYLRGPWSKSEFLRLRQDGTGGGKDFLPSVETVTGLPEPSSFALLAVGLLALSLLRRRRANR